MTPFNEGESHAEEAEDHAEAGPRPVPPCGRGAAVPGDGSAVEDAVIRGSEIERVVDTPSGFALFMRDRSVVTLDLGAVHLLADVADRREDERLSREVENRLVVAGIFRDTGPVVKVRRLQYRLRDEVGR